MSFYRYFYDKASSLNLFWGFSKGLMAGLEENLLPSDTPPAHGCPRLPRAATHRDGQPLATPHRDRPPPAATHRIGHLQQQHTETGHLQLTPVKPAAKAGPEHLAFSCKHFAEESDW